MKLTFHTQTTQAQRSAFVCALQQTHVRHVVWHDASRCITGVAMWPGHEMLVPDMIAQAETLGEVTALHPDYPLASIDLKPSGHVQVGAHRIGPDTLTLMAGPCAIESAEQLEAIAVHVAASGAQFLRGGAYKGRTSPYAFQGLGAKAIEMLSTTAKRHGLYSVCEVVSEVHLPAYLSCIDVLQVGARNMQNFTLLKAIGQTQTPVLLKRGMSATYHEWLLAAEYILSHGNPNVILCERGIRSFEPMTRNTFDINAIALMRTLTHLPMMADPSHGTGQRALVGPIAKAAVAAGAMGVMCEVHTHPDRSMSDAAQALDCSSYQQLALALNVLHHVMTDSVSSAAAH